MLTSATSEMSLHQDTRMKNVCLLCRQTIETKDKKLEDETEELEDQIFVIFLLRNVLEVPKSFCETLLVSKGNPSQWIFCCPSCSKTIRDLHKIFREFIVIQKKYDLSRQKAKHIFENSKSMTNTKDDENILTQRSRSSNEIRRFIEGKGDNLLQLQQGLINHDDHQMDMFGGELFYIKKEAEEVEEAEEMLPHFGKQTVDDYSVEGEDDKHSQFQHNLIRDDDMQINLYGEEVPNIKEEAEELSQDVGNEIIDDYSVQNKLAAPDEGRIPWSSAKGNDFRGNSDSDSKFKNKTKVYFRKTNPIKTSLEKLPADEKCTNKYFGCAECEKAFTTTRDLTKHMKIHIGNLCRCSECGKVFLKMTDLEKHMRSHNGEKRFWCSECGKTFAHKSYLKCHMNIHTGKKPYECSDCGKTFTWKNSIIEHAKSHMKEKLFRCVECKKAFATESDLTMHMKRHSGDLFRCYECGKGFLLKHDLIRHFRTHTGEKPYGCPDCKKTFARISNLNTHKKFIHPK